MTFSESRYHVLPYFVQSKMLYIVRNTLDLIIGFQNKITLYFKPKTIGDRKMKLHRYS